MPMQFVLTGVNVDNGPLNFGPINPSFPAPPPPNPLPPPVAMTYSFQAVMTPGPTPNGPFQANVTVQSAPTNFQVRVANVNNLNDGLQQAKQQLSQYLSQWGSEAANAQL